MENQPLLTISEYQNKHLLTDAQLARKLGVAVQSIKDWKGGVNPTPASKEKLARLGIYHVPVPKVQKSQPKSKINNYDGFLKDFQIYAIRKFGNTIIAKKHEPQAIVDEFAKLKIKVRVRDFETIQFSTVKDFDNSKTTHWIVEVVRKGRFARVKGGERFEIKHENKR